jgi:TonB family protein
VVAHLRGELAGAVVASLALHAVALEALTQFPRGWQAGNWSLSHAGTGQLRATLRAAAPGIALLQPEALLLPPAPPQTSEAPDAARSRDQRPAAVAASGRVGDDPRSFQPLAEQGRAELPSAGVLAAPMYYPVNQLDQRPLIKIHVEPAFPRGAAAPNGRVVLRLYIGEQGEVEKMAIVEAEPPGAFEKSALDAFAEARFTPGIKNGAPVRCLMTIEVLFGAPAPPSAPPRPPPG